MGLRGLLSFAVGLGAALLLAGRLWRRRAAPLARDPALETLAREHAESEGLDPGWVLRRARRYAAEISPSPGAPLYPLVGLPLAALLCRSLYRVRGMGQVPELPPDVTTIFVVNHRSNMDYVLLSHLLADRGVVSYAAGEWARYGILGDFVRANGSFFVRRGSGERLYRRVLGLFVRSAAEGGLTMAVFPEGGLTRDGRPREPRVGLLDYMLRGFDPGTGRDRVFVPVSVNYDWTLEDRALVYGADPRSLPPLALFAATARSLASNILRALRVPRRLGSAVVHFGPPVSAREWALLRGHAAGRGEEVQALARHIMGRVASSIPLTSTAAVAWALLPGARLPAAEVAARAEALREERARDGTPVSPTFSPEDGLALLEVMGLAERDGTHYRARPERRRLLHYYAASVAGSPGPE